MKTPPRLLILLAGLGAAVVLVAGCGGSSSPPMQPAAYSAMLKAQQSYEAAMQPGVAAQQRCLTATTDDPQCAALINTAMRATDPAVSSNWTNVYGATRQATVTDACGAAMERMSATTLAAARAFDSFVTAVLDQNLVAQSDAALNEARDVQMVQARKGFVEACS
jgi:N12 class adenine-specific DNA methylase